MASPITIHATHPTSRFFRESSTYSDGYQAQRLREGAVMGPYRAHPYQRERSHSPPEKRIDYRSTRFPNSTLPLQQARPGSQNPTSMPFQRTPQSHLSSPPRPAMYSSESHRIGVDRLVDNASTSRSSTLQHDTFYGSAASASTSPPRGPGDHAETNRLPGIDSVRRDLNLSSSSFC